MEESESRKPKTDIRPVPARHQWPDWYQELAAFRDSSSGKATWQLINTLLPYFFLWYLMVRSIQNICLDAVNA